MGRRSKKQDEPAGNKTFYCDCCGQNVTYRTLVNHRNARHVPRHIQAANTVKTARSAKQTITKARDAIVRQSKKLLTKAKKVVKAIARPTSPGSPQYDALVGSPMSVDAPVAEGPRIEEVLSTPLDQHLAEQQVDIQQLLETALGEWRTQLAQMDDTTQDQLSISSDSSSSTSDSSLLSLGDPTEADNEIEELLAAAGLEDQLRNEFAIHPEYARILVEAGKL
ncbi:hypothetical protein BKA70DRAFT_830412 [Coprinopsis sp. MPI-PUGE-AT-0042]|nr:hypothetical protein BKA70DRAFT_830412 [Coprinopsis sp. MPI-PUGE-AT-0042]